MSRRTAALRWLAPVLVTAGAAAARADDTGLDTPAPKPAHPADTGLDTRSAPQSNRPADTGLDARPGPRRSRLPSDTGLESHGASSTEERRSPPRPRVALLSDPIAGLGLAEAALGGVLIAVAAPAWASSETTVPRCGRLSGCFENVHVQEDVRAIAAAGVGVGVGLGITGALALTIIAATPLSEGDRRATPATATLGALFAGVGASAFVGAIFQGAAYASTGVEAPYAAAWPLYLTSGLAASLGIPMLVVGAPLEAPASLRAVSVGPSGVTALFSF